MKPKKRQKICHNCEADIDIDVIVCPFCAADLREEKPEQRYSNSYVQATLNPKTVLQEEVVENPKEEKKMHIFLPTLLFTLGVQLAVLSLLMLLFSQNGEVVLKWDARFWFFYFFASVPFLVFGYKSLLKI